MATALEQAFVASIRTAQGVRQGAYAAALAAYAPNGFGVFANYATYQAAIVAADVAFAVALNTASTTAGITPNIVDSNPNVIYGNWATILT
jgi:hypothetical protein